MAKTVLEEQAEDLKKQLEEAQKTEAEQQEEEIKAEEALVEDKKEDAPKEEEKPAEEAKAEGDGEAKEEKKPYEHASERRKKRAEAEQLREQLAAAQARIAEYEKSVKPEPKTVEDPEPNKADDPEAHADWRIRQAEKRAEAAEKAALTAVSYTEEQKRTQQSEVQLKQAMGELVDFESKVKSTLPNYEEAKSFLINTMALGIKSLNPRLSNDALAKAVNNRLLIRAGEFLNEGYENPVEGFYEEAMALGYKPGMFKKADEVAEEKAEKKPDLDKVSRNRARNAGTVGAVAGTGQGEVTKRFAATEMTVAEWAKLPVAERQKIMRAQA